MEDFPPPGFDNNKTFSNQTSAPPGFGKTAPPGFEQARNSPSPTNAYIKPDDYIARNQTLSKKLTNLFGINNESEYENFKQTSIEFQLNKLTASEYLARSQKLLDFQPDYVHFYDLIQEMIILLPDPAKQQELYRAYSNVVEGSNRSESISAGRSTEVSRPTKLLNKLIECQFCEQFFLKSEFSSHQKNHHKKDLDAYSTLNRPKERSNESTEDFPSLLAAVSKSDKPMPAKSTEAKKPIAQKSTEDFPSLLAAVGKSDKPVPAKSAEAKKPIAQKSTEDFPSLLAPVSKSDKPVSKPTESKKPIKSNESKANEDFPSLLASVQTEKTAPKS